MKTLVVFLKERKIYMLFAFKLPSTSAFIVHNDTLNGLFNRISFDNQAAAMFTPQAHKHTEKVINFEIPIIGHGHSSSVLSNFDGIISLKNDLRVFLSFQTSSELFHF